MRYGPMLRRGFPCECVPEDIGVSCVPGLSEVKVNGDWSRITAVLSSLAFGMMLCNAFGPRLVRVGSTERSTGCQWEPTETEAIEEIKKKKKKKKKREFVGQKTGPSSYEHNGASSYQKARTNGCARRYCANGS